LLPPARPKKPKAYLLDVGDDAVVGELAAEAVGDVEDVHEPPSVGRDVGLVDGEVEVGQHLHGLEQDASLPGAVDLHHGSAPRIISHRRREQEGTRQEAGDTGETARRLAHLHERGRGADSIVDKASGGCSAAASRRRGRALLATSQRAQLAVAGREAAEEGGGRKKIRQRERGEGEK